MTEFPHPTTGESVDLLVLLHYAEARHSEAAVCLGDEFGRHVGTPCPLPRELPFHKVVDWDAAAGRFAYDLAYAGKQPDWTYSS